jgi:hypothetical protein
MINLKYEVKELRNYIHQFFPQFYTDSQFAAPHFRQLALLVRSPEPLYVYKFEQNGGPDLYGNTLNISGISSCILVPMHFCTSINRRPCYKTDTLLEAIVASYSSYCL